MGMTSWKRTTHYDARIWRADYFVIKHISRFLREQMGLYIKKGMMVADVGCGEQPMRGSIEKLGGKYIGIDVSQNVQKSVSVIASVDNIPLREKSIEYVLCTEVLEHVPDCGSAFKEIARVLKPGGVLVASVPFCYPLHEEPFDFVRITRHSINYFAEINGLEILETEISGNEFEVMATVWDNFWSRMVIRNYIYKAVKVSMRLVMNVAMGFLSTIFHGVCPQKYYLSNLFVLKKCD